MAVDRKLLQQALAQSQADTQRVVSGQGFDPRGGAAVAGLQIAAAGLGAFTQNRAKKALLEEDETNKADFNTNFPQFAGMNLSRETRDATRQAKVAATLKQQFETKPVATPLSAAGKREADIRAGFIDRNAPKPIDSKQVETNFKNTTGLRKELTKNSGEFIKQRDAFSRIQASVEDPSAAGDLSLIFNYMKLLDPGSTVREGEFATAQNSAGVPDIVRARLNSVIDGERLAETQRSDFTDRSNKLFKKAKGIQNRRIDQFRGIAERNNLPVEDVLLDFIGGIDDPKVQQEVIADITSAQEEVAPQQTEIQQADQQGALAEIARRQAAKQNGGLN